VRYWNTHLRSIRPYIPGEQPLDRKFIKLNTNENPFPPSPKVRKAMKKAVNSNLRLYPDPTCRVLRETISKHFQLNPENVFIGNGSDEVLAFSFLCFFEPTEQILFPDITYSFYPVYAELYNLPYSSVPLNSSFEIIPEDYLLRNGGVVIPNPNAPTSIGLPSKEIEKIVLIDEAYFDFGGDSCVPLTDWR